MRGSEHVAPPRTMERGGMGWLRGGLSSWMSSMGGGVVGEAEEGRES